MSSPNILTDTAPTVDEADPTLVRSVITDAWGLYFAQGGVVMAAALRAMASVLDRNDLELASASATFCRPVACGPVTTRVEVLRDGRRGAQVLGTLHDATAPEDTVNVAVTAVFTDPGLPGPLVTPVPRPAELSGSPAAPDDAEAFDNEFPLGFLDNTEWHVASGPTADAEPSPIPGADPVPRMTLWFRFNDPPAPADEDWHPALLPIPGDALGSALVVALGHGAEPVGSVSLQMDIQVHAPIRGTWVGIDTTCTHIGSGIATGNAHLWSVDGVHVASISQTAMLRGLGG